MLADPLIVRIDGPAFVEKPVLVSAPKMSFPEGQQEYSGAFGNRYSAEFYLYSFKDKFIRRSPTCKWITPCRCYRVQFDFPTTGRLVPSLIRTRRLAGGIRGNIIMPRCPVQMTRRGAIALEEMPARTRTTYTNTGCILKGSAHSYVEMAQDATGAFASSHMVQRS